MTQIDNKNADNNPDEISIKDLILRISRWLRYLKSKWVIILCTGILGVIIGLGYAFFKKPTYKAELDFAIEGEKSMGGLGGALGLASQFGLDIGGGGTDDEFSGDNLLQLMKSRSMMEKALLTTINVNGKKETLAELYISFNNLREDWKDKPELSKIQYLPEVDRSTFTLKQDSMLGVFHKKLLEDNLAVDKIDKKISIISLIVNSKNELFSKCFTEVLAKVVSDFYIQTKTEKSSKSVAILQKQTDSVRRALNIAITGVASSIDAAPNANPLLQTLRVPSQHRQVDVTANTAILSELVKNLELSKMSLLQATPLIAVIDRPILPLEKKAPGKISSAISGAFICIILLLIGLVITKLYSYYLASSR